MTCLLRDLIFLLHDLQSPKDEPGESDKFLFENGAELVEGFAPIEYPMEPVESDQPVQCPQPEPCIIHVSSYFIYFL